LHDSRFEVLKIQLSDCSSSDISSHFATTNRFIHAARMKHAAVLVHCLAGVSRSATVVAAYLITACDMSFLSALSLIAKKRPVINPNFGFRMQLCTYADRNADRILFFSLENCILHWLPVALEEANGQNSPKRTPYQAFFST
uniref:TYR_PHOSPHATASE_2 domain-containing protein n=1 Tax=Heligmosomoides polygyrus TaxID=6339 RepID=A0A183F1X3_HELPZ